MEARIMRHVLGMLDMPMAIITLVRLEPSAATMDIFSSILGTAIKTSIMRIIITSVLPP